MVENRVKRRGKKVDGEKVKEKVDKERFGKEVKGESEVNDKLKIRGRGTI